MCVDKEHGGKRCPNDTSAMRRMRRKASAATATLKATASTVSLSTPTDVITENSATVDFKQEAEKLKVLLSAADNTAQSDNDMVAERKITQLGTAIAKEAERIVGYDAVKFATDLDSLEAAAYSESDEALNTLQTEYNQLYSQWTDVCESHGWGRNVSPNQEPLPEPMSSLSDEERTVVETIKKNRDEHRAVKAESFLLAQTYQTRKAAAYHDMNKKLAAAYQGLISAIRPVGGTVAVAEDSDASAVAVMNETVAKHYPTEWLQHHNDAEDGVIFRQAARRASYNKAAWSETETDDVKKTRKYINPIKFTVDDSNEERTTAIIAMLKEELSGYETLDVTSRTGSGTTIREVVFVYEEEALYNPEKHGVLTEPELERDGWVKKPTVMSLDEVESAPEASVEELRAIASQPRWVKNIKTKAKKEKTLTVGTEEYLKSNTMSTDTHEVVKAIAYHEFGHRMEEVMPGRTLTRLERAFLKRRSGKNDDNYYDNMTHTEGSSERYHGNTNFVSPYVGRAYYMDDSSEVFTTGIEALYGGSFGGLLGHSSSYKTVDKDHRGFVLGALAVL